MRVAVTQARETGGLQFFLVPCLQGPKLVECRAEVGKGPLGRSWSIERSWLLDFILLGTAVTQSGPHLSWAVGWLGSLCGPLSPGTGNALPHQLLALSASALVPCVRLRRLPSKESSRTCGTHGAPGGEPSLHLNQLYKAQSFASQPRLRLRRVLC